MNIYMYVRLDFILHHHGIFFPKVSCIIQDKCDDFFCEFLFLSTLFCKILDLFWIFWYPGFGVVMTSWVVIVANLKNLSFQAERFLIDMWYIMKIDNSEQSPPVHVKDIEHGGELDKKAFSPITYKKVVYVFILY